ncbi:MAG: hypothetical protein IBX69_05460 [Anaerolineales bacterium]|nr:hypothetical protein [Anaerolineales bacterium]
MSENSTQRSKKRGIYTGSGIVIGAAIGLIFGLLLLENIVVGLIIGAAAGLILGAIMDVLRKP